MFIELTSLDSDSEGLKVRIAVDKIIYYLANPSDEGSLICLVGSTPTRMKETVEEIDRVIHHGMCKE